MSWNITTETGAGGPDRAGCCGVTRSGHLRVASRRGGAHVPSVHSAKGVCRAPALSPCPAARGSEVGRRGWRGWERGRANWSRAMKVTHCPQCATATQVSRKGAGSGTGTAQGAQSCCIVARSLGGLSAKQKIKLFGSLSNCCFLCARCFFQLFYPFTLFFFLLRCALKVNVTSTAEPEASPCPCKAKASRFSEKQIFFL